MTQVDLITGFLGAGKTTFIAKYGAWLEKQGVRFAVIENEFGAAGVDRAILSEQFGNVGELSGGCICCTLKVGFYEMLAQLSGRCDRVIVEPSGLFDMDDFMEIVGTLEREGLCQAGMCLTLIDPHSLDGLRETEREVLWTELTGTGAVVWTQADVLPAVDLDAAAQTVSGLLGLDQPLEFYPKPSHLLEDADFAALQGKTSVSRAHHRVLLNHSAMFQSTALRPKGRFDRERLLEALDAWILSGEYGEILRVKGFVHAEKGSLAVNCTVGGRSVEPCAEKPAMLNIIGRNLDRAKIKAALEELADK
ncbi:MAG: CobW family GTP-binding protein [Butyricicoccus sp.]